MIRTRVGYAGGTTSNPTYHNLGDHSETIQMDYDPAGISYEGLLAMFWSSHDPAHSSWSRQYRAAVFYHDDEQKRLAEETRDRFAAETGRRIVTAIEPFTRFYLAEDYHQKHSLRMFQQLFSEYRAQYPDLQSFIDSPAVTRVNGYLGGCGTCEGLEREIGKLGLSVSGSETLKSAVCGRRLSRVCGVR